MRHFVWWFVLVGCVCVGIASAQRFAPRGQLGIVFRFDQDALGKMRLVVTEVGANSLAERIGIRPGDILLSVSDADAEGPSAVRLLQRQMNSGSPFSIVVLRGGERVTLQVGTTSQSVSSAPPAVWLGVRLQEVVPSWGVSGALVSEVVAGSPADYARIQAGDIIVQVDDTPVDSAAKLQSLVRQMSPGQVPVIHLRRGAKQLQRAVVVRSPSETMRPVYRPGSINELKYAFVDPKTSEVIFVGTYNPKYNTGPINYDALLGDALASPYPTFSLNRTPQTRSILDQAKSHIDKDIERLHRDPSYAATWSERVVNLLLEDPTASAGFSRRLSEAFGITVEDARTIMQAAAGKSPDPVKHRQAVAKALRTIGWEELADFMLDEDSDAMRTLCYRLGVGEKIDEVVSAHRSGRLSQAEALRELTAVIYPAILRRIGTPESEVAALLQRFRSGALSNTDVHNTTMQRMTNIVSERFLPKLVHGFLLTPQVLSRLYNLPVPQVQLRFSGDLAPDSLLGKTFYEADYLLKTICTDPDLRSRVPVHLTKFEYIDRQAKQAGVRIPGGVDIEAGHQLQPGEVKMHISPDGSVVAFVRAQVRIIGWIDRAVTPNKGMEERLKEWLDGYANFLTERYDAYADALPEFHRLRESAKVIALVRWAQSNGRKLVPMPHAPLRFNLPQQIPGFWTAVLEVDEASAGINFTMEGGTDFGRERGDGWVQATPNVEVTPEVTKQLAASAVFSHQAAEAAANGDLETARDLAERAARAMTGEIDLTTLPDLQGNIPTPPDPAASAGVLLQSLQALVEAAEAVRTAQVALEAVEGASQLSDAERQRIKQEAEQLKQVAQARTSQVKEAIQQFARQSSSARDIVIALREQEPIFIPPMVAHAASTVPSSRPSTAQQTGQTAPSTAQSAPADEAPLRAKLSADLAKVEQQIASTTEQLRRLTRDVQLNTALFEEWQEMAEKGMEGCLDASANLIIDTATLGLGKHYRELSKRAEASGKAGQEVLERIKRTERLLEDFEKARTLADVVDLVMREKKALTELLEAVRDGIGILADFTPLKEHPATLTWKFGSNLVDLAHSLTAGYEAWNGINSLDRTTEVYLKQVQELSDRLKVLMERAKALRDRLAEQ